MKVNVFYINKEVKDEAKIAEGKVYAHVHLLIGYNSGSITAFKQMADELKSAFPQANDDEIHCGKVRQSDRYKNFSIIDWNGWVDKNKIPTDWEECERMDYYW